jgi:lipoprotein NlpI
MKLSHRLLCALAAALPLAAVAADETTDASGPAAARCVAPGPDRAANHACAVAFARQSDTERAAGRDDAAIAAITKADEFAPDDLRFAMTRAGLILKAKGQLSPAGIEEAARAAPDDVGLSLMHGELSLVTKKFDAVLADAGRVIAQRPTAPLAYGMRATANVGRNDFEAAAGDVDDVLRLEPRSPDALRLRAILRNNKGNHDGALADLQSAHGLQPKPEDPYLIGSTQFLQRQFAASAATLARRPPAGPEGSYWLLWRYLALARTVGIVQASGSLGPAGAPGTGAAWPAPVIDFYLGAIDSTALLAAARSAQDKADLSQVCEAHFYLAEDALLRRRGDATTLFKTALQECPRNFHEYEGAAAELAAAGPLPDGR